jgi:hypothetical protein
MNALQMDLIVDNMMLANQIDTSATDELRKHKICLITDIYKQEQLLAKKKSDFFLLYDYDTEILIEYSKTLSCEIMRNYMKGRNFGITRH